MSIPDSYHLESCLYHFSEHTGKLFVSLLTLFIVPVDNACRKNGKKLDEIFEMRKIL